MKRWNIVLLALLMLCLPAGAGAEELTELFAAATQGMGEGLQMGAAAAFSGMDQELTLEIQAESARIEAGKTIRLTVVAGNPRPVETSVAIALNLPERLCAAPDAAWEAVLPAAQLDTKTGELVPSVVTFTREIALAQGGSSEEALIGAEMSMGTRFYKASLPIALCVPDIEVRAAVSGTEDGRVTPGSACCYEIDVVNSGTAPKDVAVELTLPEGMTLADQLEKQFTVEGRTIRGVVRAEAAAQSGAGCVQLRFPVVIAEDALEGDADAAKVLSGLLRVDGERVALPRVQLCGARISARMLLDEQSLAVGEETKLRIVVANSGLAPAAVRLSCMLPKGIALADRKDQRSEDGMPPYAATPEEAAAASDDSQPPAAQAQMNTGKAEMAAAAIAQDRTLLFDVAMPAAEQTAEGVAASTHIIELPVIAQEMQDRETLMGASLAWTVNDGETQLSDAAALRVYRAQFLGIAREDWNAVFWASLLMLVTISCLCAAVRARGREDEDFCCE